MCSEVLVLINSRCVDPTVLLCNFHREQAWERCLNTLSNGCRDVKDVVLGLLRMIADSQTEGGYEMNLERLFCNNIWLDEKNGKLKSWISNTWLPCYKVGFYLNLSLHFLFNDYAPS